MGADAQEELETMVVMDRVRQMLCGLHGHDSLLQFERDRMFLRCVSCGRETPGWEINDVPPEVAVRNEAQAAKPIMQPRLVSARRGVMKVA